MADTVSFYDQLADDYPLIYQDWAKSLAWQAEQLDAVLKSRGGGSVKILLDAACGIGTQAIGLAELGYQVTGSDISQIALDRAERESRRRGLQITFLQGDMRAVDKVAGTGFDAVIACDNAVPHLLAEADILQAFGAFRRSLRPGGVAVISARDYSDMPRQGQRINPRRVHQDGAHRLVLFDVWAFDGDYYDITLYVIDDPGDGTPAVRAIRGGRYFCIGLDRLENMMVEAGFDAVTRIDDAFFQPLIVGTR